MGVAAFCWGARLSGSVVFNVDIALRLLGLPLPLQVAVLGAAFSVSGDIRVRAPMLVNSTVRP